MQQKSSLVKMISFLSIAAVYLFLYIPLLVLLVFSFNTASFPSPWQGFTWNWYVELFQTEHLWQAFLNSLIVAFSATLLSLLMGILLIFYCSQGGRIRTFLMLFYGNLIIPETVLAIGLLGFFALIKVSLGFGSLIIAHTVLGLGFVIPIVYARFLELDDRMIEASLVLGATPMQTFLSVILPLLRPSLIATGLLVFILSFDDFILSYFCASSNSQTLSLYILSMLHSGISPIINALSAILLTLSSFFVFLFFSIKSRNKIF